MGLQRQTRSQEGVTLVEAALLTSIVGIALAIFVPTFVHELHTSKVGEAADVLGEVAARAQAYYEARHPGGRRCLPGPAGPTPREVSSAPTSIDFREEGVAGRGAWAAIGFQPERPLRYSYALRSAAGCGLRPESGEVLFQVRALGDLDDDGTRSTFEQSYGLDEAGQVQPLDVFHVTDRIE